MMRGRAMRLRPPRSAPGRAFAGMSLAMIVAFAATAALWAVDPRTIDGVSVWAKPLKFELALAVHAGTLALVASRLSAPVRTGPFLQALALAFLAASTVEMGWIVGQAARGQHSHFNDSTAVHRAMFSVMAFAAVVITGTAAALAAAVWRDRGYAAGATIRAGIVLGLTGGTVLTLVTAFAIGARGGPHVGEVPDLASRMAFTGWSLTGGDLRVAHFLATHMMQAVPVAAILLARARPGPAARYVLTGVAVLWATWTLAEFSTALAGEPALFLALHP